MLLIDIWWHNMMTLDWNMQSNSSKYMSRSDWHVWSGLIGYTWYMIELDKHMIRIYCMIWWALIRTTYRTLSIHIIRCYRHIRPSLMNIYIYDPIWSEHMMKFEENVWQHLIEIYDQTSSEHWDPIWSEFMIKINTRLW